MFKKLQLQPVFVNTGNVRNYRAMMDGLALAAGEGRLGLATGRAGRGKTRTTQAWHAHNGGVYMRMATVWRTSELAFLQQLCRELGSRKPVHRKALAFDEALNLLIRKPQPIFLDEVEKLPPYWLDLIRDLSDLSAAPIVLVGEEELVDWCERNRRVWSRIYQHLEFAPIGAADVIAYARDAAGLTLEGAAAGLLHEASEGDFRLVRRSVISLIQIANSKETAVADEQMVRVAIKQGLRG